MLELKMEDTLTFAMQLAPIQHLLLYTSEDLLKCSIFEIRELNYIKQRFKNKDLKELISFQFQDYRIKLLYHLNYIESASYLLHLDENKIRKCTKRQLLLISKYIFRYVKRNSPEIIKLINLIICVQESEDFIENIIKLLNHKFLELEEINDNFTYDQNIINCDTLRPAEELAYCFKHYSFVSSNILEAKAIAVGLGLHVNTNWLDVDNYHKFILLMMKNFDKVSLVIPYMNIVLTSKNQELKNPCIICYSNEINTIHLPCGHASICKLCDIIKQNNECIICRQFGTSKILYIS